MTVQAVSFASDNPNSIDYLDNHRLDGNLYRVFRAATGFVDKSLSHRQNGQGFNSLGEPEIPRHVFEEFVVNALLHRDYLIAAPIRLNVFPSRIEIISPGRLPNNLTVENIKFGNSNIRNPILTSFATRLLPYRGLGSGIMRALRAYPHIEFENDRESNLFKVVIRRMHEPTKPDPEIGES